MATEEYKSNSHKSKEQSQVPVAWHNMLRTMKLLRKNGKK